MLDILFKVSYTLKRFDNMILKGNKMKIKYIRCSHVSQNTSRQEQDLEKYDMVFTDRISGKNNERPELQKMLCAIRPNDECYVEELSRFGRSIIHNQELVEEIIGKGASITFIKENLTFNPAKKQTAMEKCYFNILSALAQAEREMIKERQLEGIACAKKKGVYAKAHPTKKNKVEIENLKYDRQCGMTEKELMNKYHISKPTLYRYLKK